MHGAVTMTALEIIGAHSRRLAHRFSDETATENPGITTTVTVEHACLTGGDTFDAIAEHDANRAILIRQKRCRSRRLRRANAGVNIETVAGCFGERTVAEPIDPSQDQRLGTQAIARADHDLVVHGVEAHDVIGLGRGNAEATALADGVIDDAVVMAETAAIDVDDLAGLDRKSVV